MIYIRQPRIVGSGRIMVRMRMVIVFTNGLVKRCKISKTVYNYLLWYGAWQTSASSAVRDFMTLNASIAGWSLGTPGIYQRFGGHWSIQNVNFCCYNMHSKYW